MAAEHVGAPSARAVLYGLVHERIKHEWASHSRGHPAAAPVRGGFLGTLGGLDLKQRAALLLRETEGLSREELAFVLDLNVPETKRLLVDARIALAEASAPRGPGLVRARLRRAVTRRPRR